MFIVSGLTLPGKPNASGCLFTPQGEEVLLKHGEQNVHHVWLLPGVVEALLYCGATAVVVRRYLNGDCVDEISVLPDRSIAYSLVGCFSGPLARSYGSAVSQFEHWVACKAPLPDRQEVEDF